MSNSSANVPARVEASNSNLGRKPSSKTTRKPKIEKIHRKKTPFASRFKQMCQFALGSGSAAQATDAAASGNNGFTAVAETVQTDVQSQTPPVSSPSDYRWISQAVYEHGKEKDSTSTKLAQAFLDEYENVLEMKYDVLQSRLFEGHDTIDSLIQTWNVILVKQTPKQSSGGEAETNYIVAFEGTATPGDWISDAASMMTHPDKELFGEMNAEIKTWLDHYNIDNIHALTGHSAGCMFVKGVFSQEDLKKFNDPYQITFNGYDPYHTTGPRQLDLRDQGDAVSACVGAKDVITVCSTKPDMGIIASHHLLSFDFEGVTWQMLDQAAGGRYNFPATRVKGHDSQVTRCNLNILENQTSNGHLSCLTIFGNEIFDARAEQLKGVGQHIDNNDWS